MTQMHLEDMGREALFYHKLQISYQPVMILAADMPELKETLESKLFEFIDWETEARVAWLLAES